MPYPNRLLVDCFLKVEDEYLLVRRKASEEWFGGWLGSLWRQVPPDGNVYQTLESLFSEVGVTPQSVTLSAIANNVFHNLEETFNVFLFIAELKEKPSISIVPEGDELVWVKADNLSTTEKVLEEYKRVFPKFKAGKVLHYHTEYDDDKLLAHEVYN